ncbi:MAG: hypothetical protein KDA28_09020, partial [Phycisphaerales bacterium]|nr:hypothetical protein [Phycisphaerales bacterium]
AVRVETDEAGEKRVTELTGERPYFYGGHQGPFWARVTALGEATVQLEADKYHELKVEIPGAGGAGGGGE